MSDYTMRMVVSIDHSSRESLAFQLYFDDLPAHPISGAGYLCMYHASVYLLSVLKRDIGAPEGRFEEMAQEIFEKAEEMAAMDTEVTSEPPDIPGNN